MRVSNHHIERTASRLSTYHGNVIAELAGRVAVGVVEGRIIRCCDAEDNNGEDNCWQSQEPKPRKSARRCLVRRINLKLGKSHDESKPRSACFFSQTTAPDGENTID